MSITLETAVVRPIPAAAPLHPAAQAPLAIATDRCKGCELCISACAPHVLALDETFVNKLGYHPVRLTDAAGCTSCAKCARVCPDVVFTVFAPAKER